MARGIAARVARYSVARGIPAGYAFTCGTVARSSVKAYPATLPLQQSTASLDAAAAPTLHSSGRVAGIPFAGERCTHRRRKGIQPTVRGLRSTAAAKAAGRSRFVDQRIPNTVIPAVLEAFTAPAISWVCPVSSG